MPHKWLHRAAVTHEGSPCAAWSPPRIRDKNSMTYPFSLSPLPQTKVRGYIFYGLTVGAVPGRVGEFPALHAGRGLPKHYCLGGTVARGGRAPLNLSPPLLAPDGKRTRMGIHATRQQPRSGGWRWCVCCVRPCVCGVRRRPGGPMDQCTTHPGVAGGWCRSWPGWTHVGVECVQGLKGPVLQRRRMLPTSSILTVVLLGLRPPYWSNSPECAHGV